MSNTRRLKSVLLKPLVREAQALLHKAENDPETLMYFATRALDRLGKLEGEYGYLFQQSWNSQSTTSLWH